MRHEVEPGTTPPPSDEFVAGLVQDAVERLIAGKGAESEARLARLPAPSWPSPPGRPLTAKEQLRTFFRDQFTCRYCARRTIFIPVLRALSVQFPERLPFHHNWATHSLHPIYATYGCTWDLPTPARRGGRSGLADHVTACNQCKAIKQDWLLEELRWNLQAIPEPSEAWDGLYSYYLPLCRTIGLGGDHYHSAWVRAVTEQTERSIRSRTS